MFERYRLNFKNLCNLMKNISPAHINNPEDSYLVLFFQAIVLKLAIKFKKRRRTNRKIKRKRTKMINLFLLKVIFVAKLPSLSLT